MVTPPVYRWRTDMASPLEREAAEYLTEHQILELLDNLVSMLLYERPAKPVEFLVQQLEKLKSARQTKKDYPSLFDESNVDAVFGILDPTKQGHITLRQYREALKTLGIKDFEMNPTGAENDKITLATFKKVANVGLMNACATFKTTQS
ncbi:EF-hand calcium-binding domain-containing protein 10 [Stegostoma tigrinum]|uniref:EF-hand calcium-binding domain-containing protein 10 n=1 Tax=Stegostoma tigrinum TaxID=3053191 RepID=UPI00287049FB|nr:EF-hand calcium-binding domain-containing protein 10 [Stegostoma tigrinum]